MGVVYRVFDRDLRRRVAMKVMLGSLGFERDFAARFVAEAQATAQLQHPGIVPVYEIGITRAAAIEGASPREEGRLYFTMKLVRGRTLADVVAAARAGHADAAEFTSPWTRAASGSPRRASSPRSRSSPS